jgi:hypothetical protein
MMYIFKHKSTRNERIIFVCIFMNEIYFYTFFRRIFFRRNTINGCSFLTSQVSLKRKKILRFLWIAIHVCIPINTSSYVHTNIWPINQLVKLRSLLNYRQTTSPADRNIAIYRLKEEYIWTSPLSIKGRVCKRLQQFSLCSRENDLELNLGGQFLYL